MSGLWTLPGERGSLVSQSSHTPSHWGYKHQTFPACPTPSDRLCEDPHTHQAPSSDQLCTLGEVITQWHACFSLLWMWISKLNIWYFTFRKTIFYHRRDSGSIFHWYRPGAQMWKAPPADHHPGQRLWCWWWLGCQIHTWSGCSHSAGVCCHFGQSHKCLLQRCLSWEDYLSRIEKKRVESDNVGQWRSRWSGKTSISVFF